MVYYNSNMINILPERFHMSVDESFVHGVSHSPGTLELADEFVVDGAAVVVDQLDLLVGAVVSEAIVDHNIEPV